MYRKKIKDTDPEVYSTLKNELIRQQNQIELIVELLQKSMTYLMAKDDPSTGGNPIQYEVSDFYNLYQDSFKGIL